MNITLSNQQTLRGDMMLSVVLRSDLVPIPETIEAHIRYDSDLMPYLAEGQLIRSGVDNNEYKIIYHKRYQPVQAVQGNRLMDAVHIIAILYPVYGLSKIQNKAVIKQQSTLGTLFKTCGATASIATDIPCGRFACFAGSYPTIGLMRLLVSEGASVLWTGKQLAFIRNKDLFQQTPAKRFEQDTSINLSSDFLERHTSPAYYSTDLGQGGLKAGDVSKVRTLNYTPLTDERVLRNMSQVLYTRKLLDGSFNPSLKAGYLIELAKQSFVIITAAHAYSKENQYSRLWLGSL